MLQEEQTKHGKVQLASFVRSLTSKEEQDAFSATHTKENTQFLQTFSASAVQAAAEELKDGSDWTVSTALEAAAAVQAATQRKPGRIKVLYKVGQPIDMTSTALNKVLGSLKATTIVWLYCLDSFYTPGRDGRAVDRERLSVCLSHEK